MAGERTARNSHLPVELLKLPALFSQQGLPGDGADADPLAGGVHVPQRGDRALAGLLSPAAGGRDDVV
jgi:hypothetical protein